MLGSGPKWKKVEDLKRQLYSTPSSLPWLVFVAENESALLDVCRVESERAWITRMIRSVSDPTLFSELRKDYERKNAVLAKRRTRVRNALVHGNPSGIQVVRSVNSVASFLSRSALQVGLKSFVSGDSVSLILERSEAAEVALIHGTSVLERWRAKARTT